MAKPVSKRYSQKDLDYFKKIILEKIESAEKDLSLLKESFDNSSSNVFKRNVIFILGIFPVTSGDKITPRGL